MDIEQFARAQVADRDLGAEPAFPHDIWHAMAEAGLFRIGLDPAQGGSGGGYADIARAEAALIAGGGSPGLGSAWASHQMVARYFLERFGDAAQRAAYLPALASGRITASVAISEPGAGAHPKHLRTTATRRGDAYVLDGEKAYITNGPIADFFVVLAITATENGRKRYSAFLVPQDAPGLVRVPMRGDRGAAAGAALRLAADRMRGAGDEPDRAGARGIRDDGPALPRRRGRGGQRGAGRQLLAPCCAGWAALARRRRDLRTMPPRSARWRRWSR